jgi:hypothetical protein
MEWGVVASPRLELRPLPEDAPRYVTEAWQGIGLLVAVRRLTEPGETLVPLARTFVSDWCGCDEQEARRALAWLERNGFVWRVGSVDVGKAKAMNLWAVAEGSAE